MEFGFYGYSYTSEGPIWPCESMVCSRAYCTCIVDRIVLVTDAADVKICRDENWLYAEVDTPPGEQIDFVFTYEQLLRRRLGACQLSLPLGQNTSVYSA